MADTAPPRKWFLNDLGHEGLNNLLAAYEDKSARAVCTFGFSQGPGHEPVLFQGITEVSLASPEPGERIYLLVDSSRT